MSDTQTAPTLRELLDGNQPASKLPEGQPPTYYLDDVDIAQIEADLLASCKTEIATLRTKVAAADKFARLVDDARDGLPDDEYSVSTALAIALADYHAYDATKTEGTAAPYFGWPIHTNASGLPEISVVCEGCGAQYYWPLNDRGELELTPMQMECDCTGTAAPVEKDQHAIAEKISAHIKATRSSGVYPTSENARELLAMVDTFYESKSSSDTPPENTAPDDSERDRLGRIVRDVWVEYAEKNGDTDPSHLRGWDELDEYNREVDRQIGERVAMVVRGGVVPVEGIDAHLENVKRMSFIKRTKFWDELQQRAHKGREGWVVSWPDVLLLVGPDDWEAAALSVAGEKQVIREDTPSAVADDVPWSPEPEHLRPGSPESHCWKDGWEIGYRAARVVADAGETEGEDGSGDDEPSYVSGAPLSVRTFVCVESRERPELDRIEVTDAMIEAGARKLESTGLDRPWNLVSYVEKNILRVTSEKVLRIALAAQDGGT